MNGNSSNKITHADTLRIVADLMTAAEENGATTTPYVGVVGPGYASVMICTDTEIPHRDIAAWQLATGRAWDVRSNVYPVDGVQRKARYADVVYRGVKVSMMLSQPAEVAA